MRRRSLFLALAFLLLCALAVTAVVLRQPARGLRIQLFSDPRFESPTGAAFVSRGIHFGTGDRAHPVPKWVRSRAGARLEGYFEVIRAGEFFFDLSTDDAGWLFIDDALLIDNSGEHAERGAPGYVTLGPGVHRIRIDHVEYGGGAALKLRWQLPGTFPPSVLVPVSLLFPAPPAPVGPAERLLRISALLLLAASLLAFSWPGLRPMLLRWREPVVLLLVGVTVLALAVRLYDLNGAGETCDEQSYVASGRVYAQNLASGVFDPEQWKANREHPPVGKLWHGFLQFTFGDSPSSTRAGNAVLSAATVLVLMFVALRLFGLTVAAFAGLVLALLPSFVAHAKVAALDTPATFFFTVAAGLLLVGLHEPALRNRLYAGMTVAVSLGIATKFSVGLVVPFIWVSLLASQWKALRATGRLQLPFAIYVLPITAFAGVGLLWPWLWGSTGEHLRETFGHWQVTPRELFLGHFSNAIPITYFAVAFAFVTPALLVPAFLIGIAQLLRRRLPGLLVASAGGEHGERFLLAVLVLWFVTPFGWSASHFRQDGIRYVHAAFPPFALLCGLGLAVSVRWVSRLLRNESVGLRLHDLAAGLALTGYLAVACAGIHPYYLDYFSEFVGGPRGVYTRRLLETSWWGEGLQDAGKWLNENAPPDATFSFSGSIPHPMFGLRADLSRRRDDGDFHVRADLGPGDEQMPGYREEYRREIAGIPIFAIYRRLSP